MSGLKIRASDVFELPINHETLEIYCWQTKSTISLAECEEVVANIINSHDKLVDTVTKQEKVISELVDKIQLNTEILTAIMERKPIQGSDYHAISCTIKNNKLLTAKHKHLKG